MNQTRLPKLVISLTSPYARRVRIAALERGIEFETVVDVPWNEETGVVKLNPLGKVPIWVTEEGEAIYDSRVIVEYLDTLGSQEKMIPEDIKGKIQVKRIEALAEGIMDASLSIFAERKKRPADLQYQWWIDRQFAKIFRGLDELSKVLADRELFYGLRLSAADIAVVGALGYVGLRFSEDFSWQERYPKLAKFYSKMMERDSVRQTVPVL